MSDDKKFDTRTPDQIVEGLMARRKVHKFMTKENVQEWDDSRPKRPVSKNHWSYKANKIKHVLAMGALWKRLAKKNYKTLIKVVVKLGEQGMLIRELEADNISLRRMLHRCSVCGAPGGSECNLRCSRDGSRDQ